LLPKEQAFSTHNGVWNLSAEQGSLGTLVITNVRLVWFAQLTENFNASIPWTQVKCLKIRDSKYGTALVVETSDFSGGYVLGFRVSDKLDAIYQEASKLFDVYSNAPVFGVDLQDPAEMKPIQTKTADENIEIIDTDYDTVARAKLRYEVGKSRTKEGEHQPEIVFNEDLGLACEALPEGLTVEKLWRIF
jgi:Bardet-Biedl syndrome 5 protein